MTRITLFIPYFGTFPNYFQLYLNSLGANTDVLTVVLITDIDLASYTLPPNLRVFPMTFDALRHRIHGFLATTFGRAPSESVVSTYYKLVDFKIMYPLLFEGICADSWDSPEDFVGWGDIDVIYGKLGQFVSSTTQYDIIGGWHGHFTAIKNTTAFKQLATTVPNIYELCTDTKIHATDEIAYREPLIEFIKTHQLSMCYLNATFCDIVPPCFYSLFRKNHAQYTKNFINVARPQKNIAYLRVDGVVTDTVYDDGDQHATSYVHLQKRAMTVPPDIPSRYYITGDAFVVSEPTQPEIIPRKLFMTWSTKTLPPKMQENVDLIIAMNPEFVVQMFDDAECKSFLDTHFPPEVVHAYDELKPGAYKADLWRLCVLYIHGGIYLDIKLQPVNGFRLTQLLTREYFVSDGEFRGTLHSIYNGLIACKAQNTILKQAIDKIVSNVSMQYYGDTPWCVTGPRMLAPIYHDAVDKEPLYLSHMGPVSNEHIVMAGKTILENYKEYRKEAPIGAAYYISLWNARDIYVQGRGRGRGQGPSKIRLHIPAIPYTITRSEYSHDAFTGKVKRFAPMMRSILDKTTQESVFEVYHYGVETSESGADKEIQLMTRAEWHALRIESIQYLDKARTREEAEAILQDPETIVGVLANWDTPLFKEFNCRFREHLQRHYRSQQTDIVCIPLGRSYDNALHGLNAVIVEVGIGYNNSCKDYRIFESHSWLSKTVGEGKKWPHNYWFVIPHGFDVSEFSLSRTPSQPRIGFLGRIVNEKGCRIIVEVAKRFPHVEFVLCGQGDPAPFLTHPNIQYKQPIHGAERSAFLGSCIATMCPTTYLEPFGCSAVESQLCGTPVISVDNGGYVETVEQFRSGLRCHTLADFCKGVQMALDGAFDRTYIRERAVRLYDMFALAKQYEYVFRSVLDIYTPSKNGWYSPDCHLVPVMSNQ